MTKSIFITGAASGIGKATAISFAQKGWNVGLFDINEEGLKLVADTIGHNKCMYQKSAKLCTSLFNNCKLFIVQFK